MGSISADGYWNLEFRRDGAKPVEYRYELEIKHQVVEKEILWENGRGLLERMGDKGTIRSKSAKRDTSISPPKKELTLRVRRDIEEFPFFQDFVT